MTRLIPDRATGTEPDGVRGVRFPRYIDWSGRTGSGSLVTTAGDLARFVEALFGGRLLGSASLAKILAPADGFAYGWSRDERFGRKLLRSGGRSPGFNASVERYLDDGTTVVVLTNSYSPVGQDSVFLDGLESAVFGQAHGVAGGGARAGNARRAGRARGKVPAAARLLRSGRGGHAHRPGRSPRRHLGRWRREHGVSHRAGPLSGSELLGGAARDPGRGGKVTGFDYRLLQGFLARRVER